MDAKHKPRILLFCRPYLVSDFEANFEPLSGDYDFTLLTDGYSKRARNDTREAFYRYLSSPTRPAILNAEEAEDCIQRCRLLRNLPRPEAERRMSAMAAALTEWFDKVRPDMTISHLVDDYITQLICILSRKRGIPFIAYSGSFFPGHVQLIAAENGIAIHCRQPNPEEIKNALETIRRPFFRQNYGHSATYTFRTHLYRVCRYYVKRVVFFLKGIVQRDPLHLHYAVTPYLAERRRLSDYPSSELFAADWREQIASATGADSPIYFPLGYFPEATTDYWIKNRSILQYEKKVIEFLKVLGRRFTVVVKEHPHMMGIRSPRFYERLRAIPGVVMVHPMEYSSEVMVLSRAVIIGSGSGGVEATLRDKPIFTFCNTSYWYEKSRAVYLDLDRVEAWPSVISEGIARFRPLSEQDKYDFIATCLSCTVHGRPGGKRWDLVDPQELKRAIDQQLALPRERHERSAVPLPELR